MDIKWLVHVSDVSSSLCISNLMTFPTHSSELNKLVYYIAL